MNWKYYLENSFLSFADIGSLKNLPVMEFKMKSSFHGFYSIDSYIVSSKPLKRESLGTNVIFKVGYDSKDRYLKFYQGVLASFSLHGSTKLSLDQMSKLKGLNQSNQYIYKINVRPELWKLSFEKKFRIFQNKTKKTVIKEVLEESKIDFLDSMINDSKPLDSITQYNETTWDFLIRLIEEENVIAYFNEVKSKYESAKLVLSDSLDILTRVPISKTKKTVQDYDFEELIECEFGEESIVKECSLSAYNFNSPSMRINEGSEKKSWVNKGRDSYIYKSTNSDEVSHVVRGYQQQDEAYSNNFTAETTSYKLFCGSILSLSHHFTDNFNGSYLINESSVEIFLKGDVWEFRNYIKGTSLPKKYFAKKTKVKPIASGNQVAIVHGSDDNKHLNIDKIGRIQVNFPWNSVDGKCVTSWVRLMHWGSAGSGYGNYNYPRVGQEVVVGFLNSDPDLPVVLGSLYNGGNHFPNANYGESEDPLHDSISKAGVNMVMHHKSFGELGTSSIRYNEISMINKELEEKINLISQMEVNVKAGSELKETIGTNRYTEIEIDDNYKIFGNRFERFGSSSLIPGDVKMGSLITADLLNDRIDMLTIDKGIKIVHIKSGSTATVMDSGDVVFMLEKGTFGVVGKSYDVMIYEAGTFSVLGSLSEKVGGDRNTNVLGDFSLKVEGEFSTNVVGISSTTVEGENSITTEGPFNLTGATINMASEAEMSIESAGVLSIKASAINIEAGDISIKGAAVNIAAGAAFEVSAGAAVSISGAIVQLG